MTTVKPEAPEIELSRFGSRNFWRWYERIKHSPEVGLTGTQTVVDGQRLYTGGKYYMICLEALPCIRYAPYIYRTDNFLDWEVGIHNPIMMWSDEDRKIKPGSTFTLEERDILETGLNINCSDIDLCEYEGKTRIFYSNGDQMTYSFLCEAEYDGPLDEFLEAFFR